MEQQSNPNQGSTPLVSEGFEWYWQANLNEPGENASQGWVKYPSDMKQVIETSYNKKEATVDLGDDLIFFTQMIQVSKRNLQEQKKVKRVALNRNPSPREQRFTNRLPLKALDKTFGSSKEFLAYVSARSGDFVYQHNGEFWLVPTSVSNLGCSALKCITNKCEENGSDVDRAIVQKMEKEIQNAIKKGKSLKVYEAFLQTYTEECFLYRLIDKLLLEEDWRGLEEWSSYIIILASAFISMQSEYFNPKYSQVNKNIPATLYRGTQLTKEDMKEYDSSKNRYFSWNTFTSATKRQSIAKSFSKERDSDVNLPVLFEIDTCGNQTENQLLDLEGISSFADELEVLIAPGTIFELLETNHQGGLCIINLRIVPMSEVTMIPTLQLQNGKLCQEIVQKKIKEKSDSLTFEGTLDSFALSQIAKILMQNQTVKELNWKADIIENDHVNGTLDFCKALSTTSIGRIFVRYKVDILRSLQYSPSLNSLYIEVWTPQSLEPFVKNLVQTNVPHIRLKLREGPDSKTYHTSLGQFVGSFKDPAWKWRSLEIFILSGRNKNMFMDDLTQALCELDIKILKQTSNDLAIQRNY